jgi:hypothetical protein
MSFIFSQALVEEFSAGKCLGIDAFVPLSGSPTPRLSLWHDKTMELSRLSRFGMTCKPLTDDRGAALLTWWRAVFLARTSALPGKAQESRESAPGCGPTWRGSLAKFDQDSCSWKTVQLSLLGDSELSSVIWPRSGMTADGQCWELPMLGRRIKGTDSGLLPTPIKADSYLARFNHKSFMRDHSIASLPEYMSRLYGMSISPKTHEILMGWPIGHTDLKRLGTARCPNAQPQHGKCLEADE